MVVIGTLRGIAHAGAGGRVRQRIWALSIEPSPIRIADLVACPPRGGKPVPKRFEVAEIQMTPSRWSLYKYSIAQLVRFVPRSGVI